MLLWHGETEITDLQQYCFKVAHMFINENIKATLSQIFLQYSMLYIITSTHYTKWYPCQRTQHPLLNTHTRTSFTTFRVFTFPTNRTPSTPAINLRVYYSDVGGRAHHRSGRARSRARTDTPAGRMSVCVCVCVSLMGLTSAGISALKRPVVWGPLGHAFDWMPEVMIIAGLMTEDFSSSAGDINDGKLNANAR